MSRTTNALTGTVALFASPLFPWKQAQQLSLKRSACAEVHIWNAATGQRILTYLGHLDNGLVLAVAWSPDGTRIASSAGGDGGDAVVDIWRASTGQTLFTYQGHVSSTLSSGLSGGSLLSVSVPLAPLLPASGSGIGVFSVAWSPDSSMVASGGGSGDGSVQIWKSTTHERVYTFPASNGGYVSALAWSPGGAYIASADYNVTNVWQSKA